MYPTQHKEKLRKLTKFYRDNKLYSLNTIESTIMHYLHKNAFISDSEHKTLSNLSAQFFKNTNNHSLNILLVALLYKIMINSKLID